MRVNAIELDAVEDPVTFTVVISLDEMALLYRLTGHVAPKTITDVFGDVRWGNALDGGKGVLRADHGLKYHRDLDGIDGRETFVLDVDRQSRKVTKIKYQLRARTSVVLARLEIDGSRHTNPDGETIGGTHLHVYRDGVGAAYAIPVDPSIFRDTTDPELTLVDFCRYINVEDPAVPGQFRLVVAS